MENIYQAPAADLTVNTATPDGQGSLEKGIAGEYEFSIGDILGEAWEKTSGSKGKIWLALLLYIVAIGVTVVILKTVLGYNPMNPAASSVAVNIIYQLVQTLVSLPLMAGLIMIAIKLSVRAPAEATDVVKYFHKLLPLIGTMILMYVLIVIGFLLLVIPGIYLAVSYVMAIPLVVEKNLGPWQALEASRKAITHRWFSMFGLYLVIMVIFVVASIPLMIGLIWALPMALLAFGIVYRIMFGVEAATMGQATPEKAPGAV